MTEKQKEMILAIVAIILIVLATIAIIKVVEDIDYPEVSYWEEYTIKTGDTLWDIVPKHEGYSKRFIIQMVKDHNNIDSNIKAFDKIELPVWEDK